jgi:ketosteroid isomerase-like protein
MMMRRALTFAVIFAATEALAAGQERRSTGMERVQADKETLEAIEREFPAALLRGDATYLARYTADDFQGMDPAGRAVTKADVLARLKASDVRIESLRHEDIQVRVFGDCAVATARTVLRASHGDQDVSGVFLYMRVWVRREGRWQAVAALSTTLPKEPPSGK